MPDLSIPAARASRAGLALALAATLLGGCAWRTPEPVTATLPPVRSATVVAAPAVAAVPAPRKVSLSPREPAVAPAAHLAQFGRQRATPDVHLVADWVVGANDAQGKSFVIVDKKDARVFLFDPAGKLVASAPALLGAAVGDDPVPGIGEKPLKEVKPEEKTTPAGRFVAEPGVNANGEDIVWVSYDLAVSMHRVRPLVKAERRLQRLASPTPKDNRISFGCINLPVGFYERVLRPQVLRTGAIVYVLPETRTPQQQFGIDDSLAGARMAGLSGRKAVK
jgi:hypothetical protein